jgi:hypothetical protein
MELYEAMRQRRSVRGFKSVPIPPDALARICEAVRLAPTACNLQPFKFLGNGDGLEPADAPTLAHGFVQFHGCILLLFRQEVL